MTSARREYETLYIGAGYCKAIPKSVFPPVGPVMGGLNRGGRCDEVIAIQYPGIYIVSKSLRYGMCVRGVR